MLLLVIITAAARAQVPPEPPACTIPSALKVAPMKYAWELLSGPHSRAATAVWRGQMHAYRAKCLAGANRSREVWSEPSLRWTETSFVQPLVMPFDRALFNQSSGEWTVDAFLDGLRAQYGGVDSVLLWPTCACRTSPSCFAHSAVRRLVLCTDPQLGIDSRNQFDMTASLPGGLPGLKAMVAAFHRRGVAVSWPFNPWDQGTRGGSAGGAHPLSPAPQVLASDARQMAALLAATDSDGYFGDTISSAQLGPFYEAAREAFGFKKAAATGSEAGGTPNSLAFAKMGWVYPDRDFDPASPKYSEAMAAVPPVDYMKWLEPRWMSLHCDRYLRRKVDLIQIAYFNVSPKRGSISLMPLT